jgi:hypothetical protein
MSAIAAQSLVRRFGEHVAVAAEDQASCFSIVSPPETSNFPGPSTLSFFTTPSS